jgi:hypothetical protein
MDELNEQQPRLWELGGWVAVPDRHDRSADRRQGECDDGGCWM